MRFAHSDMSQLARLALVATYETSVGVDATAHACAERYLNKVIQPTRYSIAMLAEGTRISVVVKDDR